MLRLFIVSLLLAGCSNPQPNSFSLAHESEPLIRVPTGEPDSIDPRLGRSSNSTGVMHLLYEGLMRDNYRGELVKGMAAQYDISKDQKTYTFHLRDAYWSNEDPVTARDFAETWMSQLDPAFPSPNVYQLFVIKGARQFKEGSGKEVGIHVVDDRTLVVELESPTPYFLELLGAHFSFPVHASTRDGSTKVPVGNGPFVLKEWKHHSNIKAEKNKNYWDAGEVKLDEVEFVFVEDNTALNMFLAGELDWVGSPNSTLPNDSLTSLEKQGVLHSSPSAGTQFFRFNTANPLLQNKKFRQALAYAIDRDALTQHLMQGKQSPARGLLPESWRKSSREDLFQPGKARELFEAALEETHVNREELKPLTLCYPVSDRNHRIVQAIQQQWQKAFGLQVNLEQCESVSFYERLQQQNYDISLSSWLADFKDPISFLELFKDKRSLSNNTGWENSEYTRLLNESSRETDTDKRLILLERAEDVLLEEMPIAPIFHLNFLFAKKENVHGIYFSEMGHLDFKYAFIDDAGVNELE